MNVKREFKKVKVTNSLFVCCYQWNRLGNEQASKVPAKPSLILLDLNMLKMKGIKFF
jgi:CheY-like chemotaxis protein